MILKEDRFVRIECNCSFCKEENLYGRIAKLVRVLPEDEEAIVRIDDREYWYRPDCLVTVDHDIELI